jgi:hypothetical protein
MSPNRGARPVTRTSGRTLIDCLGEYLEEYLARPDVVEQLKPVEDLPRTLECVSRNVSYGVDNLQNPDDREHGFHAIVSAQSTAS